MHYDPNFYITLAIIVVIALVGLITCILSIKKKRVIEDTPTSKIRSASQGYVELAGKAKKLDDAILTGPLTGKPCLWYSYKIEKYQSNGKSSSWRTIENKISQDIFGLEDNTGTCYIYPKKAETKSLWKDEWRGNQRHPLKMEGNKGFFSVLGSGRYRYTESRIQEGDFLYALGFFETSHPPSPTEQAKRSMSAKLNEWKQDYDKLLARFDTNGDGEIDLQEWEGARKAAFNEAKQEAEAHSNLESIHTMAKPPTKQPFIISNKDPKELASHYNTQAILMGLLFIGASAFLVHFLRSTLIIQ